MRVWAGQWMQEESAWPRWVGDSLTQTPSAKCGHTCTLYSTCSAACTITAALTTAVYYTTSHDVIHVHIAILERRYTYNTYIISQYTVPVPIISLISRGIHRYTNSNPPLDLDQLDSQVVKTSALESRSRGFESRPSGL